MKMTMLKMMILTSMVSIVMKTPMSMGMMLMMQTLLMIMMMNKMMTSSWFIMITFLMMIGGLLILFTYMSSIASNEKFKMNLKTYLLIMTLIPMMEELMMESQVLEKQNLSKEKTESLSMSKMYSKTMSMTMLMVIYLLLSMITIAKIVKHHEGPLRSKTYEQINTEKK
uniref:NADH dehydrogenase subunit 6 n=1 Tax=Anaceratagallia venosa TaxID=2172465 RepID=UPI0030033774|nr:NADH dehydrogenase subunit 6 [Anaceratagallia venosa]